MKNTGSNKPMRQYVVANWKMYLNRKDAEHVTKGVVKNMLKSTKSLPKVILCPSHPYLTSVYDHIKGSNISLGAQGCYPHRLGPNTGEVSVQQVKDVNAEYVIVGHSEHRKEHTEKTSRDIRDEAETIIEHGLVPILCVGESFEDRKKGQARKRISQQLAEETPRNFAPGQLIVAYEPLWCIGADRTPTRDEIEEMHETIRHELDQIIPNGKLTPILYGGSVHTNNAKDILACKGVHGVLVGRQGLKLEDLWEIINSSET